MNLRSVVITGASSGIGRAMALEYAGPGVVLALFGRDTARLCQTATVCAARGAIVEQFAVDVMDQGGMANVLAAFDARYPIELLIANAGISTAMLPDGTDEPPGAALEVIRVNILGSLHTLFPVLAAMRARGAGQIALMGSIAARPGLPYSPAYSASKAAIETYGFALAGALRGTGVCISIISPGFIVSPMSAALKGPKPFMMSAERAARIIRKGLARKRLHIRFPRILAAGASLAALLPSDLAHVILRRFAFRVRPEGN